MLEKHRKEGKPCQTENFKKYIENIIGKRCPQDYVFLGCQLLLILKKIISNTITYIFNKIGNVKKYSLKIHIFSRHLL